MDPSKTEISVPEARGQGGAPPDASGRARRLSRGAPDADPRDTGKTLVTPDPPESSDPSGEAERPPPEPGTDTALGLTAAELAAAVRDARTTYAELPGADRGTLWAAVGLMASTLAPFVGVPGDPWRPGIMAGGWALVLLAAWALALVGARARALGIVEATQHDVADNEGGALRRISLKQLLCGALATGYTVYLGVFHQFLMDARTVTGQRLTPILRPGLAVALFFATGLAYAGLARFRADARRRRGA
ncbi:MAG: hypothetical protein HY904_02590 [Deltaproteobacteria bacterium]|nr:hypothetical protein [Deltaproteobacteria bacterium]